LADPDLDSFQNFTDPEHRQFPEQEKKEKKKKHKESAKMDKIVHQGWWRS
jgi:hypothetical protein